MATTRITTHRAVLILIVWSHDMFRVLSSFHRVDHDHGWLTGTTIYRPAANNHWLTDSCCDCPDTIAQNGYVQKHKLGMRNTVNYYNTAAVTVCRGPGRLTQLLSAECAWSHSQPAALWRPSSKYEVNFTWPYLDGCSESNLSPHSIWLIFQKKIPAKLLVLFIFVWHDGVTPH